MRAHPGPHPQSLSPPGSCWRPGGRSHSDEANGWGILDHGVGSLEKVHVVNGRTVDVDMGQEAAYVYMAGSLYRLRSDVLTEED